MPLQIRSRIAGVGRQLDFPRRSLEIEQRQRRRFGRSGKAERVQHLDFAQTVRRRLLQPDLVVTADQRLHCRQHRIDISSIKREHPRPEQIAMHGSAGDDEESFLKEIELHRQSAPARIQLGVRVNPGMAIPEQHNQPLKLKQYLEIAEIRNRPVDVGNLCRECRLRVIPEGLVGKTLHLAPEKLEINAPPLVARKLAHVDHPGLVAKTVIITQRCERIIGSRPLQRAKTEIERALKRGDGRFPVTNLCLATGNPVRRFRRKPIAQFQRFFGRGDRIVIRFVFIASFRKPGPEIAFDGIDRNNLVPEIGRQRPSLISSRRFCPRKQSQKA